MRAFVKHQRLHLENVSASEGRALVAGLRLSSRRYDDDAKDAEALVPQVGEVTIDGVVYTKKERRQEMRDMARNCRGWRDQVNVIAEILERALRSREVL